MSGGMISVRFTPAVIARVRHWAKRDGVSVSQWIRNLIDRELSAPGRQPPVDVALYPRSETVASGTLRLTVAVNPWSPSSYTTSWPAWGG